MLMLLVPTALMIHATSSKLINLFYSSDYVAAAHPLGILVFGISFLSATLALATIMQGYGVPSIPLAIFLILIPANICLQIIMIPRYELFGAALATSLTCLTGLIISCAYIKKLFKILVDLISFIKIVLASSIIYYIALKFSFNGFLLIFSYIGLFLLYFLILLLIKEIKRKDILFLRSTFARFYPKHKHMEPLDV